MHTIVEFKVEVAKGKASATDWQNWIDREFQILKPRPLRTKEPAAVPSNSKQAEDELAITALHQPTMCPVDWKLDA